MLNVIKAKINLGQHRIRKTDCYKAYNCFVKNQYKPIDELWAMNYVKRQRLLLYAFHMIPFYRDRFTEVGLHENDLYDPNIWNAIPILTKHDLVEYFDNIKAPGMTERDYYISNTGGSTGKPVKVLHDISFQSAALEWRMLEWWGLSPNTDYGRVWRFPTNQIPLPQTWRARLKSFLPGICRREVRLDASCMDDLAIKVFINEWNKVRPPLLAGYVGGIHHLASVIHRSGLRVHYPKAIWVTSAPLSTVQRRMIENTFHAPVYDQYGSCEVYWLAAECRCQQGLHMFVDIRHIEFVTETGNPCPLDTYGRILITDLENMVFPLIRYENGDIGRQFSHACKCGITLPLMDSVKGRLTDNIRLKDGTVLSGEYLTTIFDDNPDVVSAFQVQQHFDYSITIRVVPNRQHPNFDTILERIRMEVVTKVQGQVPVSMERTDEILADRGKTRYVLSDIQQE